MSAPRWGRRAGGRAGIATLLSALVLAVGSAPGAAQSAPAECPIDLEVLVERTFAASREVRPGDVIGLRSDPAGPSCDATVAGVFEPPADPSTLTEERPRIVMHVPHLAALSGRGDEVDHFTLRLREPGDAPGTAGELAGLVPGAQVLATADVAERTSTTFAVVSRFHRAIGLITMVAGGVFLACIMVLKVQERRAPIAAARLVGIPRSSLLRWTIAEAGLVSALGGVLGIGLGLAASAVINAVYQRAYDTRLVFSHVTADTIGQALVLAVVLGLGAGVFAGRRLMEQDPLREIER